MLKPQDFYFFLCTDPKMTEGGDHVFFVVLKETFDKEGAWSDNYEELDLMPKGFSELTEASWVYEGEGDREEGRKMLVAAGFVENDKIMKSTP